MQALYAILFDNGILRIGKTPNLSLKTSRLISSAKSAGVGLSELWVTPYMTDDADPEWIDICKCAKKIMRLAEGSDAFGMHFICQSSFDLMTAIGASKETFIKCNSVRTVNGKTLINVDMERHNKTNSRDKLPSEKTVKKVLNVILSHGVEGVTFGVLKNRTRPTPESEIAMAVSELKKENFVSTEIRKNKSNGIEVLWIFPAAGQTTTA